MGGPASNVCNFTGICHGGSNWSICLHQLMISYLFVFFKTPPQRVARCRPRPSDIISIVFSPKHDEASSHFFFFFPEEKQNKNWREKLQGEILITICARQADPVNIFPLFIIFIGIFKIQRIDKKKKWKIFQVRDKFQNISVVNVFPEHNGEGYLSSIPFPRLQQNRKWKDH